MPTLLPLTPLVNPPPMPMRLNFAAGSVDRAGDVVEGAAVDLIRGDNRIRQDGRTRCNRVGARVVDPAAATVTGNGDRRINRIGRRRARLTAERAVVGTPYYRPA